MTDNRSAATNDPTEAPSLDSVLADLGQYLAHAKEEGSSYVSTQPATVAELGVCVVDAGRIAEVSEALDKIAVTIRKCSKCSLAETRTNAVPGQGTNCPEIMFVGEAPGRDEDEQGLAFVGRAGKLLTKMIQAMGLEREDVFIGNILKCRPPNNRPPTPDETAACMPYLKAQIVQLKPKVIVALGATATKGLLDTTVGISKLRGKWMSFEGIDTMPTYHPAYLLRNPAAKKEVWDDLQAALKHIGRKPPKR